MPRQFINEKKKVYGTERKTGKLGDLPSGANFCHVAEGMTVHSLKCVHLEVLVSAVKDGRGHRVGLRCLCGMI
jgi:hypothetical protein